VVKLSAEEREQLEAMICAGKHPAQSLTKGRILLKADVSALRGHMHISPFSFAPSRPPRPAAIAPL